MSRRQTRRGDDDQHQYGTMAIDRWPHEPQCEMCRFTNGAIKHQSSNSIKSKFYCRHAMRRKLSSFNVHWEKKMHLIAAHSSKWDRKGADAFQINKHTRAEREHSSPIPTDLQLLLLTFSSLFLFVFPLYLFDFRIEKKAIKISRRWNDQLEFVFRNFPIEFKYRKYTHTRTFRVTLLMSRCKFDMAAASRPLNSSK